MNSFFQLYIEDIFLLLSIAQQVEAEWVRWWQDVVQKVHSSF